MDGTAFDPSVPYEIREAYHNTFVTGIPHPNRVMEDHDLIYLLEGEWEIRQEPPGGGEPDCYTLHEGDVLILEAGRHHDGLRPCRDGTRTVYLHVHGPGHAADSADMPTPSFLPLGTFLPCRRSPEVLRLFEAIAEQFAAVSPLRETRPPPMPFPAPYPRPAAETLIVPTLARIIIAVIAARIFFILFSSHDPPHGDFPFVRLFVLCCLNRFHP